MGLGGIMVFVGLLFCGVVFEFGFVCRACGGVFGVFVG